MNTDSFEWSPALISADSPSSSELRFADLLSRWMVRSFGGTLRMAEAAGMSLQDVADLTAADVFPSQGTLSAILASTPTPTPADERELLLSAWKAANEVRTLDGKLSHTLPIKETTRNDDFAERPPEPQPQSQSRPLPPAYSKPQARKPAEPSKHISALPKGPPPLVPDPEGIKRKPDPSQAVSLEELGDALREFWMWVGCPSSRKMADWSDNAFSHATANKLLSLDYRKRPKLTLPYLRGMLRAFRADDYEEQLWVDAWRVVTIGIGSDFPHGITQVVAPEDDRR